MINAPLERGRGLAGAAAAPDAAAGAAGVWGRAAAAERAPEVNPEGLSQEAVRARHRPM